MLVCTDVGRLVILKVRLYVGSDFILVRLPAALAEFNNFLHLGAVQEYTSQLRILSPEYSLSHVLRSTPTGHVLQATVRRLRATFSVQAVPQHLTAH